MCVSKYYEWNADKLTADGRTDRQTDSQKSPLHPQRPFTTGVLLCGTYTSRQRGQPVCNISAPDSCFVPLLDGFVHRPETGCPKWLAAFSLSMWSNPSPMCFFSGALQSPNFTFCHWQHIIKTHGIYIHNIHYITDKTNLLWPCFKGTDILGNFAF